MGHAATDQFRASTSWALVAKQIGWAKESTAKHDGETSHPFEGANIADGIRRGRPLDSQSDAAHRAHLTQ